MKPDPASVLLWLRQLERAGLVEPSPRLAVDVERLLRLRERWPADELGACLASLLAYDEVSWRQIDESFREWHADQRRGRLPPERVVNGPTGSLSPTAVGDIEPLLSLGATDEVPSWVRRVAAVAWRWRWVHGLTRARWVALLSLANVAAVVLVLVTVKGLVELDRAVQGEQGEKTTLVNEAARVRSLTSPETKIVPLFEQVEFSLTMPAAEQLVLEEVVIPEDPWWAIAGLFLVSTVLMGLAIRWWMSIGLHRRQRQATADHAARDRSRCLTNAKRLGTPYHLEVVPALSSDVIEDVATLLARLTKDRPGHELDVEPTIARTMDAGGRIDPVFVPSRHPVPLLVLVDVETGSHPDLHRVEQLLTQWHRGGLEFVRYDFEFQPNQLRVHGQPQSLATVANAYEGVPLLIVSRWSRPEDYDGRLPWLQGLSAWPNRVWLDLDPRPADERSSHAQDLRAMIVSSGLARFPFTEAGLLACARTLTSGGEHSGPIDDAEPVDLEALAPKLELWAACACLVPDPIWPQLQAIREEITELREAFPNGGDIHRLIEWLRGYAARESLATVEDDDYVSPQMMGHGERLMISRRIRNALKVTLREHDAGIRDEVGRMEHRARSLLVEQLLAADVRGDEFERLKRDLKISVHRAVMDRREAGPLLADFGHTAVARELQGILQEEQELQRDGFVLGGTWFPEVWEGLEGRFGRRDGAYLRDLLRRRAWSWGRLGALAGLLLAWAGSYGVWREGRVESIQRETRRVREVVRPALLEVRRIEIVPPPCEVVEALKGVASMTLKCVSGGEFEMGSRVGEDGRSDDEGPRHKAKVAPFAIGVYEVTQKQWEEVMGENPSDCVVAGCGDDLPVQSVSWIDSVGFLNELSRREGLQPCYREDGGQWGWDHACNGYRLPTETEWEWAARAMTTTAYSFGTDASELDEYAWHDGNSDNKVHPVGEKKANPWGLYDMHGNAWEWVWDWYGEYEPGPTAEGHDGPEEGEYRVLRGGSFRDSPQDLRSANRLRFTPTHRFGSIGFRCARSLSAEPLDRSTP